MQRLILLTAFLCACTVQTVVQDVPIMTDTTGNPTRYRVVVQSALIQETNPPWDSDGTPPDVFVCATVNTFYYCSGTIADSYRPVWNQTLTTITELSAPITVDVWDQDGTRQEILCPTLTLAQPTTGCENAQVTILILRE